jgi:hypothetical protein
LIELRFALLYLEEKQMLEVRPVADPVSHQHINNQNNDSLLKKVWNAVVEFFTQIVKYICETLQTIWENIKNVFAPQPAKLALYKDMPVNEVDFIEKSIQIYEGHLQEKEEAVIAALPAGAKVSDEQRPLHTFKEESLMLMNIPTLSLAVVRGGIFSDRPISANQIRFFRQVTGQEQGLYDPPVQDPETGQLLHNGGYTMRDLYEDRTVQLRFLKAKFDQLSKAEKEIVLNKTDFGEINQMAISQNAKDVLNGIAAIAHLLHQHNRPFMEALQVVHERRSAG